MRIQCANEKQQNREREREKFLLFYRSTEFTLILFGFVRLERRGDPIVDTIEYPNEEQDEETHTKAT